MRTSLEFFLGAIPRFARIFTVILALFSIPRYEAFIARPGSELNKLSQTVLRLTLFVAGSIGTSWGSICLFQNLFPRTLLPTQRWFLGGFLAGFWALLERKHGRPSFMYSLRASIDSLWKVGVKRGWWRSGRNGDVWVFVGSLMLLNAVYEVNPSAVDSAVVRKCLSSVRGESWVDKVEEQKTKE